VCVCVQTVAARLIVPRFVIHDYADCIKLPMRDASYQAWRDPIRYGILNNARSAKRRISRLRRRSVKSTIEFRDSGLSSSLV